MYSVHPEFQDEFYLSRPPGSVNLVRALKITANPINSTKRLLPFKKWKKISHTSEFYYSAAHCRRHDLALFCIVTLENLGPPLCFSDYFEPIPAHYAMEKLWYA
jgi:hypothetical protein